MNINIGIPIDLEKLISTRFLIQAGSGGGKSYVVRKVVEAVGSHCQQIILDPEGEFVTLREKFDFALVAKGGDIPLTLKYAETLAHKLLETSLSAIIDLYELKQHERILFVKRFLDAMMNAPKELWHSCLVYVDEAHVFCPESSKSESMSAVIDLCTRGRKRGFAAVLATQRLSKLHKDAAAECNNKMIGRTGLDIDRKRAGDELGMISKTDMISLRDLQPGEFYAFGPAISHEVIKFKVAPVITTHLQAGKKAINIPPTPDAIKKILTKLKDIPEEAEKELHTKQQLQAEVTKLRTEITKAKHAQPIQKVSDDPKLKEQIKQYQEKVQAFKDSTLQLQTVAKNYEKIVKEYQLKIDKVLAIFGKEPTTKIQMAEIKLPEITTVSEGSIKSKRQFVDKVPNKIFRSVPVEGEYYPGRASRNILTFLATFPDRTFSKAQVAIASGYAVNGGGFNNAIGEINSRGLIVKSGDRIQINESADLAFLGNIEIKNYSIETFASKLGKCEREIYEVLLDRPADVFTKEELAALTPSQYVANAGGFNNALGSLNTLELIKREGGRIRLNPELLEL